MLTMDEVGKIAEQSQRLSGWKMDALIPIGNSAEPMRAHYLVAVTNEMTAKRCVAKEADVSVQRIESVSSLDGDALADFGLDEGEIIRFNYER